MANIIIQQLEETGYATLHPKNSADITEYTNTTSGLEANNTQDAIDLLNQQNKATQQKIESLDSQIKNLKRSTLLKHTQISSDISSLSISLKDINWDSYDKIGIDVGIKNGSLVRMGFNELSSNSHQIMSSWAGTLRPRYYLCPNYSSSRFASCLNATLFYYQTLSYSELEYLLFDSGGGTKQDANIGAGSYVNIYGEW